MESMHTSFAKRDQSSQRGFTLTELLVVIATLALLAALMLPALSQGLDRDMSIKVQCANQLRQLGVAMTAYAGENNGSYLPVRGAAHPFAVQRAINQAQSEKTAADIFLVPELTNGVDRIWSCPDVTGLPVLNQSQGEWLLGYNYYGGIQYWVNRAFPSGTPSYSPVTLSQAHPGWVLASDSMNGYLNNGAFPVSWAIGILPGTVPHRRAGAFFPDGANECFVDGSVTWVKFEATLQLTEFMATYELDYMYQSELPPAFTPAKIKTLVPPY